MFILLKRVIWGHLEHIITIVAITAINKNPTLKGGIKSKAQGGREPKNRPSRRQITIDRTEAAKDTKITIKNTFIDLPFV